MNRFCESLSEENVGISEGRFVLDGVPVAFILHDGVARKIQHARQRVTNALTRLSVVRILIPYGDDVLLMSNRNDGSTNLLADHKLFAHHG